MTSVWDDPEIQVVNEYVKFEAVGDKVVGDVISVSKHTFAAEGNKPAKTVASIVIRTDDGADVTLNAGQVKLAEALNEARPEAGDRLSIEFVRVENRGGGKRVKPSDAKPSGGGARARGAVGVEVDTRNAPS